MIDKYRLVHLVFLNPDNTRWYFVRTDRRFDPKTGQWPSWPLTDNDPRNSVPMTYEFAERSRRLWSAAPFNLNVRIALDPSPTSPFVDPDPKSNNEAFPWAHTDYLVTVTEAGEPTDDLDSPWVYEVKAVHTTSGRQFVLKFETATLQSQSQFSDFSEGPERCVWKAFERGFTKFEKPKVNPHLETRRREAKRRADQQATRLPNNLRPGDR